ncbi:MAG: TonB-dependent receptor [Pseudomonadota bacterium]|nr:TonB-dependent receptor [Pseudomonadota bacterium]
MFKFTTVTMVAAVLAYAMPSQAQDVESSAAETATDSADAPPAPYDTIPVVAAPQASPPPLTEAASPVQLDDVVVTASKRQESSRTLAAAVTAIGKDRLEQTGASGFSEYLSLAPGVNFNSGTPGYSVVTIRGISSDTIPTLAQTAVGIYFDDIPLTDPAAPMVVPDIDAFDAERIEILRGPQGALLGSASLGGAINYIPEAPNLFEPEFAVFGSGNLATNSSLGGSAKLMLNTPLFTGIPLFVDGLAVRVVGHYTRTPGFIDNVGTGEEQSNENETFGGRAVIAFAPTPASVVRLSGLYQKTEVHDAGYVDESLGDLRKSTLATEPSSNEIGVAALRYGLEQENGSWAFIGGVQDKRMALSYDGATALGLSALGQQILLTQDGEVSGYSAELRYVSAPDTFEWLAGVSYANREEVFNVNLDPALTAGLIPVATALLAQLGLELPGPVAAATTLFRQRAVINAPESAAFLDATWHISPKFKLTAGGRAYHNVVDSAVHAQGLLVVPGGSTEYRKSNRQTADGFNPKVSFAWQASNDVMAYALYSKGYRLGGPNLVPSTPLTPTKQFYEPDEVNNFEIGTKTAWFDGALTLDLAAFYIDWADIPLVVSDRLGLFKYLDNAGDAASRGIETTLAARPLDFLTVRSSLTYLDAQLKNDFDPNNGRPPAKAGDQLPGAPEWTATTSLTGLWFWNDHYPTVTLIHRYEGASPTNISYADVKKGDFHLFDLRAGMKFGRFGITAYGKNLTDERAVMASNNYAQLSGEVLSLKFINPPRTFGLEMNYSFGPQ